MKINHIGPKEKMKKNGIFFPFLQNSLCLTSYKTVGFSYMFLYLNYYVVFTEEYFLKI